MVKHSASLYDSETARQYECTTPQGLNDHSRMMIPSHPAKPMNCSDEQDPTGGLPAIESRR
jgi:hypothetical protein